MKLDKVSTVITATDKCKYKGQQTESKLWDTQVEREVYKGEAEHYVRRKEVEKPFKKADLATRKEEKYHWHSEQQQLMWKESIGAEKTGHSFTKHKHQNGKNKNAKKIRRQTD